MFFLLNIKNPFKWNCKNCWNNYWYWDKKLSSHKFFEIEKFFDDSYIFKFELNLNFTGKDHAGPEIGIILFSFGMSMRIYDSRHWDYENNHWEENTYKDL